MAIGETPAGGGSAMTTGYAWCGSAICQSRTAAGVRLRSYYGEGEFVSGTPGQSLFYGLDQVGSVRRVFASASSAPAYAYDPYGVPLGSTTPVTDFAYAGLLNHPSSGLYLARYRSYDPFAGRWLSRDPLGETSDPAANLYRYVNGDPLGLTDIAGEFGIAGAAISAAFNFGSQVAENYANTGDLRTAVYCVDLRNVALSGLAGFFGPGFFAAWGSPALLGQYIALAAVKAYALNVGPPITPAALAPPGQPLTPFSSHGLSGAISSIIRAIY